MSGDPRDRFDDWEQPDIAHGEMTEYNWIVHRPDNLQLAEYVDVAAFTVINAHGGVKIESGVQIGPHCDIHSKSTIDEAEAPVVIREGARIGSHTTILPGVEVGSDAVIGSHSVVRVDVPSESLAVGSPAEIKD
jgi:acetyltransferase-like isoleucine patch superfamily enzyme